MRSIDIKDIFPDRSALHPICFFFSDNDDVNSAKEKSIFTTKPIKVYFADDDKDDRELFREALDNTELNVKLNLFNDGKDLINKLKNPENLPDIVILDLNMPNKNGIDCLNFIRENEGLKNVPVAIYSTSSAAKDIEEAFERGANIYISKPSSFNDLIEIIRKLMITNWEQHQPKGSRKNFIFSNKNK